ncbi:hypothetical protein [Georgenia ruanii]|uniref:hypothetical protein n=1 Tax=Georgenia ruanii TaxID=348442 RepID=UPI001265780F|nr:hypothetical protein [Georgenia ruanii]
MSFDAENLQPPSPGPALAGEQRADGAAVAPRSAVVLVAGSILAVVGGVVAALAWASSLQHALVGDLAGSDPGRAPMVLGALAALAGIALQIVGVWRLASGVDYLAQREKDREHGRTS